MYQNSRVSALRIFFGSLLAQVLKGLDEWHGLRLMSTLYCCGNILYRIFHSCQDNKLMDLQKLVFVCKAFPGKKLFNKVALHEIAAPVQKLG